MKKSTLLLFLFIASFATIIGQTATVHVQDGSGTAIVGASVTLDGTTIATDDNGDAAFPGLADGMYPYDVTADCYEAFSGSVEIAGGDAADTAELSLSTTNDVFVNLVPPGGLGFPPSGVTVRLYNDDLSFDETVVTGGFTTFTDVPYGTYNFTLSKDCFETVTGTTTVECTPGDIDALVEEFGVPTTTNDVFVNLVPPGGLGFPPSGVTVRLYNDDLSFDETVVTGGFTTFTDVPYGTYNFTLSKDCFETVTGTTTVECTPGDIDALVEEFGVPTTTNDVFVNLVPPGGLGFPPSGVTVRLYNDDLSFDETVVTGGFTTFTDVPYGTYNFTLSKDCFETVTGTTTVECTPGDIDALVEEFGVPTTTNDVFVNLVPPGGLGFPPSGVTVRLYNDDLSFDETVVTGGFTTFTDVPYGTYNFTLSKDCFETVTGTTTVECTPGDIDALVEEFGVPTTTNDVFVNLVPPGGLGFPPSGVTVRLYNDDLSFDETVVTGGFTTFTDVPYGTYNFTLSKDCFETVTGTTTVECTPGDIDALVEEFGVPTTTNDVFVNLVPPGGLGFPPSGVTVRLYNDDLSFDETVVTGGFTTFTDVPYGTYNFTLSKDCFETVTGTTTVECTPGDIDALVEEFGVPTTTNDVFVNLVPPGGLGFPPSGVTVRLYNDDLSFDETVVTGGFTTFTDVPYGTYNFTLSKDCFETVTGTTTVECTPGDIDALVEEFGVPTTTNNLFFFVGNLLQEPDVTITVTNTTTFEQTTIVGQNILGDYILENLPYGEYDYVVSKECFVSQTGQVVVDCQPNDSQGNQQGNAVFLDNMVPTTTNNLFFFIGNLLQEPGATITVTNTVTLEETTIVGQNILGDYIFENLPYGEYDYVVSKECFVSQTGQAVVDCQPNDSQGNQQGNAVFLDNMVPVMLDNSVTQLEGTLTANATGVSYQWTFCDGTEIEGETNASFTPTASGDYAVVITDDNCSTSVTSECFTVMVVGTTSINAIDLSVYPNPVRDELRIDFEENESEVVVRIFNPNGQLLINKEFPQADRIQLDLSRLLPGTYLLDVTHEEGSVKTPIIKL